MVMRLHKAALAELKGGERDYYSSYALRDNIAYEETEMSFIHRNPNFFGGPLTTDQEEMKKVLHATNFPSRDGTEPS